MEQYSLNAAEAIELELTFLASELPKEIIGSVGKRLTDVYVPESGSPHPTLRLRQKGDSYEITKKQPLRTGDASAHRELTIPLSEEEYRSLAGANTRSVSNIRYAVMIDGYPAEVDVFQGALAGLVLIDFEFTSEDEKTAFTTPASCLADVTQEDFIAGGILAGKHYQDLADQLIRFKYQPLYG
jgi:CYTH domain-containing protein